MKTEIIYEDNDILICRKPAGLPTQTARIGLVDMVSELKNHLAKTISGKDAKSASTDIKITQNQKKAPYLAVIHRLDQPVEGLLVFAKNPAAAKTLSQSLQSGNLHKKYYAVCYNQPLVEEGMLEDYMIKDTKTSMAKIVSANEAGAKKAVLRYKMLAAKDGKALYDVEIETGRFHQIRAQMAHAQMPLLGDQKYADEKTKEFSRQQGIKNVALCAYELKIMHPKTKQKMSFVIQPEGEAFVSFFE